MDVRSLMRPDPVTLGITDTLDIADDLMRLGRIRHLPIVDEGRVVGIVTQRDLLRAAVSSLLELSRSAEREWLRRISVLPVMTKHVFTVGPSITLRDALEIMLDKRVGCLPVVDEGRLVGLLTETDCLHHLRTLLAAGETRQSLPELAPAG